MLMMVTDIVAKGTITFSVLQISNSTNGICFRIVKISHLIYIAITTQEDNIFSSFSKCRHVFSL